MIRAVAVAGWNRLRLACPSAETLLRLCVLVAVLNIGLVIGLAGTGTLKTAQTGDIRYLSEERTPTGSIPAREGRAFVVERPTDVDAFYDTVVRVQSGGPLFNPWGGAATIQRYHYHPMAYFFFLPLSIFGYIVFKFAWLAVSLAATAAGTYLLLRAEQHARPDITRISNRTMGVLVLASLGFAPMISNFKVGQTTPIMYFFVALAWWFARRSRDALGGAALIGPALFKPYFIAPLVVFWHRHRWRGSLGFLGMVLVANLAATVYFGPQTTVEYYDILVKFATKHEGTVFTNTGFGNWWSNSLRMFFWFGPLAIVIRLLLTLPLGYLTLIHLSDREYETELFCLSLVTVMFLINSTSVIDLAIVLAAVMILGIKFYEDSPQRFTVVAGAFLLMHLHPYFMEATVGYGATRFAILQEHTQLVLQVVSVLQPAMYGLFILWIVILIEVYDQADGIPRPSSLRLTID